MLGRAAALATRAILLALAPPTLAQSEDESRTVRGKVVDRSGKPLPCATAVLLPKDRIQSGKGAPRFFGVVIEQVLEGRNRFGAMKALAERKRPASF